MTFDWKNLPETALEHFKGGAGTVYVRTFADKTNKIMVLRAPAGAGVGEHVHETNSEICYVIAGTMTFTVNGVQEETAAGQSHYCPSHSTHASQNNGTDEVLMVCVIPEHGGEA